MMKKFTEFDFCWCKENEFSRLRWCIEYLYTYDFLSTEEMKRLIGDIFDWKHKKDEELNELHRIT